VETPTSTSSTPAERLELAYLRGLVGVMDGAAKVIAARLVLLIGVPGAIGLTYVDREAQTPQLVGLGIYCGLVGSLVWLAGRR
jgi:hypothetical protein